MSDRLLAEALRLRAAGILAFPASAAAKHPDRGSWFRDDDGYKPRWTARYYPPAGWPTIDQTHQMFRQPDVARLFVITGARSGNLICFDIDAPEIWEAFFALISADLRTRFYLERSQRSGGRHLVARVVSPVVFTVPARTPEGNVRIEVRAEGQGFAAAPGVGYERLHGDLSHVPTLTMDEYRLLLDAAATFNQYEPPTITDMPREPHKKRSQDDARPGDRYNRECGQQDVLDLLERHGWRIVRRRGSVVDVLRPGDSTAAHSGSVNAKGVLCVFSTSTPFVASATDAARPYDPFSVYATLEHGGDFHAAGRELYRTRYAAVRVRRRAVDLTPHAIPDDDHARWLTPRAVSQSDRERWLR